MKARLAATAVRMSKFKMRPAAVLRGANHRPVAVLKRNRVAFYVLEPRLFEAMMDEFANQELCGRAASRLADKSRAIEVDIDEL